MQVVNACVIEADQWDTYESWWNCKIGAEEIACVHTREEEEAESFLDAGQGYLP
jgi:hypothetical protein